MKRVLHSFTFALSGLAHAIHNTPNLIVHLSVGTVVLVLSAWFRISRIEFLVVVLAIFFVIIAEMLNTAIEEITNLVTREHRQEAKIAKDVAAASVLLAAFFAVVVGIIIFLPHLLALF